MACWRARMPPRCEVAVVIIVGIYLCVFAYVSITHGFYEKGFAASTAAEGVTGGAFFGGGGGFFVGGGGAGGASHRVSPVIEW